MAAREARLRMSKPVRYLGSLVRRNGAGAGGADRIRTDDPLLAKQVLSQLSYSPLVSSTRLTPAAARPSKDGGPGRI